MPNEMLAALSRKRSEYGNPGVESPVPEKMSMEDYWAKIQEIDSKLDQILALVGGGKEVGAEVAE